MSHERISSSVTSPTDVTFGDCSAVRTLTAPCLQRRVPEGGRPNALIRFWSQKLRRVSDPKLSLSEERRKNIGRKETKGKGSALMFACSRLRHFSRRS